MAFDGITVAALVHELQSVLAGGRIARIAEPEANEILLTVKTSSGQQRLILCADPSLPLAYLASAGKPSPLQAPSFLMLLRKHLAGGRILSVTQPDLERVIRIEIEHLDELGDTCRKFLILELMGKHSNLIFVNEEGMILDAVRHVSGGVSSVREVLPGRPYFIPNTREKHSPLALDEAAFSALLAEKHAPAEKALNELLTGISPLIAGEISRLAGLDGSETAAELSAAERLRLFEALSEVLSPVREGAYSPRIYYHGGKLIDFSPIPLSVYAQEEAVLFPSVSAMLEAFYAERSSAGRIRQKSADLRHILTQSLERCSKKRDIQQKQLKDTEKRDKYRLYGELIRAYGYGLEPGAKELVCENYYNNNEEIRIPLDETLNAQENAQKYFERYQKLRRTFDATTAQLAETDSELAYLRSVESALALAESEQDLAGIKAELAETGWIRRSGGKKGEKQPKPGKPLHYRSAEGFDYYVGKNNIQNEELSFRFASGNDWWFHIKTLPGSHVIVKTGGRELSDKGFEEAAALAAWYSSAPRDGKAEVDYTRRKELKKPAHYRPGMVIYHTNYSMVVRPSTEGLTLIP
ncbi:MAG: NFACT family protein [Lachnospiraceae bacterium]|nr:NFACT family protein [Lachnospiraceae bacterium]